MILQNAIEVRIGGMTKKFNNPKELSVFLTKSLKINTHLLNPEYSNSINTIITKIENFLNNPNNLTEIELAKNWDSQRYNILDSNQVRHLDEIITHDSEKGIAILALMDANPNETTSFYKGIAAYYDNKNPDITHGKRDLDRDAMRGYINTLIIEANSPVDSKPILQKVAQEHHNLTQSFNDKVTELKKELETVQKENQEIKSKFNQEWEQIKTKINNDNKTTIETSNQEISKYRNALEEQMSLSSSTNYWWRRTGISFVFILLNLLLLSALPTIINKILNNAFGITLRDTLEFLITLDFKYQSPYGVSAIAIFSSLLLFYIISTSVKIIINQVNIINQSLDKITKTRYFLSLMAKKDILKAEDRQYMLKAIFEEKPDSISAGNIGDGTPGGSLFNNKKS